MAYAIKVPSLLRKFFGDVLWEMPVKEKLVYLTFDDGPHPTETGFVLEELRRHQAKGSFFCIGDNVRKYPDVYQSILDEGHTTANHSYNHLNGWKTETTAYITNVQQAATLIDSKLFRPPYGRITRKQVRKLKHLGYQTIMWSVISADFDQNISPQQCVNNVMKHVKAGSIIVFHDSDKASKNLRVALPEVLSKLCGLGYHFASIPQQQA
jgi:peptidoglycan-N-acetylglucosamine deacetylase